MALVTSESLINVLGVVYTHRKTTDGGDIYLTKFGIQFADLLKIENWYEKRWFRTHRERLEGTSSVYRVPTKRLKGRRLELVVKNCRVGEDVPLETRTLIEFMKAEFNSPWEEFALVMEMRDGHYGPREIQINTQLPLAIYVPPEKMQIWQSGRSQEKINRIKAMHPGIDLDIIRQYKLVYGWIKGQNVVTVFREVGMKPEELDARLPPITAKAVADMEKKGYVVMDMKPDHVIIGESQTKALEELGKESKSPSDTKETTAQLVSQLVENGQYSVVDYELLTRTPEHDEKFSDTRRHSYLDDQRDRFNQEPLPPHLVAMDIFGVPYVFGHAESTAGLLWVVGRNPRLFDYFLPERWRKTHSWALSEKNEVYYTITKDHIHFVWKTSRVGEEPQDEEGKGRSHMAKELGYNSPFEEFAIAHYLSNNGVPTVYIRAIYMTGSHKVEPSVDLRRYESHKDVRDLDDKPVLRLDRNYITIRGFYNGPDQWVAKQHGKLCAPLDLVKALEGGYIAESEFDKFYDMTLARLRNVGYDGSLLERNDLLLALDPNGVFILDDEGLPEVRICNFELLKKI